ncbi:hypothetical protein M133_3852 [Bacteroides fragilis str. S24L26]|nr:hypothetical protein M133_3852 [Bacteroides fragilis str. S24L26]EYA78653.1 hypothetical protein M134_3955 [Bacteroides fragilis str. S24L34]
MHSIIQPATMAGRNLVGDTPFCQVVRQCGAEQGKDLHLLKNGSRRFRTRRLPLHSGKRCAGCFRYEPCLREKIGTVHELSRECEDVTPFSQTEIIPDLFLHIHMKRRCAFAPVRCGIPQLVTASFHRFMPQP